MPAATISASAAETAAIVEELPEVSTETTVIANTDENIAALEAVTTLADEIEEAVETETTAAADIKEVIIENTEYKRAKYVKKFVFRTKSSSICSKP